MVQEDLNKRLRRCLTAWRKSIAEERCGTCGARVHRTQEELELEAVATKIEEIEGEAPTRPKMKKIGEGPLKPTTNRPPKRLSSRPPKPKE